MYIGRPMNFTPNFHVIRDFHKCFITVNFITYKRNFHFQIKQNKIPYKKTCDSCDKALLYMDVFCFITILIYN